MLSMTGRAEIFLVASVLLLLYSYFPKGYVQPVSPDLISKSLEILAQQGNHTKVLKTRLHLFADDIENAIVISKKEASDSEFHDWLLFTIKTKRVVMQIRRMAILSQRVKFQQKRQIKAFKALLQSEGDDSLHKFVESTVRIKNMTTNLLKRSDHMYDLITELYRDAKNGTIKYTELIATIESGWGWEKIIATYGVWAIAIGLPNRFNPDPVTRTIGYGLVGLIGGAGTMHIVDNYVNAPLRKMTYGVLLKRFEYSRDITKLTSEYLDGFAQHCERVIAITHDLSREIKEYRSDARNRFAESMIGELNDVDRLFTKMNKV